MSRRPKRLDASQLQKELEVKDAELLEASRRYEDMKRRYEGLLRVISQPGSESGGDDDAGREVEQWKATWAHVVSAIRQVIECPRVRAASGSERRAALVDLVGRLCDVASRPREEGLRHKYRRCKRELRRLREQSEALLRQAEGNKQGAESRRDETAKWDEGDLAKQIRGLEKLLREQLDAQTEFLRPEPIIRSPPHRKSHGIDTEFPAHGRSPRKCLPIEDSDDQRTALRLTRRTPRRRQRFRADKDEEMEEVPPPKMQTSAQRESADRKRRQFAEREADEVLREIESARPREKKAEDCRGGHVEELMDLANRLRDDYSRLGYYFNDEPANDLSIAQLSKMNDSLLSAEHRLAGTLD
jgi:hypothetical protein